MMTTEATGRPAPVTDRRHAMFQLVRALSAMDLAVRHVPGFVVSVFLTGVCFGSGHFVLKTGAFLATWLALHALVRGVPRPGNWRPAQGQPS